LIYFIHKKINKNIKIIFLFIRAMGKKFILNIKENKNEPEKFYTLRNKFITNLKPKNDKSLALISMYSHILVNMVYLKCRYNDKIEKKIYKYLKKIQMNNLLK
jgi:hypothetical protein